MTELAVLSQDPWYGGGGRALAQAFCDGARALGRDPKLYFVSRTRATSLLPPSLALAPRAERYGSLTGVAYPSLLPELDAANQLLNGIRIAPLLRGTRTVWVVSGTAPLGFGAARARAAYGCWIASSVEDEWKARATGFGPSRRLAMHLNRPLLRRLERHVIRGAAAVCTISPASRRRLAEVGGVAEQDVRVLPIPVDSAAFEPESDESWLARLERPTIVFVGRAWDARKNLPLLLDAFARLRARVPAARLRLVGEPPRAPVPGGVEVLGEVNSVAGAVRSSSLLVLPSLQEGFGIVVAEALAAGVPVVVTPCGGPEELVRSSGGGVVTKTFGAGELATTIGDLLDDAATLAQMRRQGSTYVRRVHSPDAFVAALSSAFEEVDGVD